MNTPEKKNANDTYIWHWLATDKPMGFGITGDKSISKYADEYKC